MSPTIFERELISLRDAARIIPTRPHVATIGRWVERGCRGHRLRSWRVGGHRFTSREAIEDFLRAINGLEPATPSDQRRSQIEAADREWKRELEN